MVTSPQSGCASSSKMPLTPFAPDRSGTGAALRTGTHLQGPTIKCNAQPADVLVSLEESHGPQTLRITDRGIGMTPEVVADFFLRAGASYTIQSQHETQGALRAGRFGVGVLASFLLGDELQVTTRHVSQDKGLRFRVTMESDIVELWWSDAVIGTEIEIKLRKSLGGSRGPSTLEALRHLAAFYRFRAPRVAFQWLRDGDAVIYASAGPADCPTPGEEMKDWHAVPSLGFDSVHWLDPERRNAGAADRRPNEKPWGALGSGDIVHNGLLVAPPETMGNTGRERYVWNSEALGTLLGTPAVAVVDAEHRVALTLNRYGLVSRTLPFEDALVESIGRDVVARALALGPVDHPLGRRRGLLPVLSATSWMPMIPALMASLGVSRVLAARFTMNDLTEPIDLNPLWWFCGADAGGWADFPWITSIVSDSSSRQWPRGSAGPRSSDNLAQRVLLDRVPLGALTCVATVVVSPTPFSRGAGGKTERVVGVEEHNGRWYARHRHFKESERLLRKLANWAFPSGCHRVTYSLYEGRPDERMITATTRLAAPWLTALAGPLPLDRDKAASVLRDISKSDGRLGAEIAAVLASVGDSEPV